MKTNKIFFAAAIAALSLSACSEMDETASGRSDVPVRLTATELQADLTRAAQNLNEGTITSGENITVAIGGNTYTYQAGTAGALTDISSDKAYYPATGTIDLQAYYPADAASEFTVQADQQSDANYKASDLMYASATGLSKSASPVALTFAHKMAKLEVNVGKGDGVDGNISSITVSGVNRSATFTASTGSVAVKGTTTSTITMSNAGAALFPEQEVAAGDFITVNFDNGKTATYALGAAKTFTAGKRYIMNITVNATAVTATTSIGTWDGNNDVLNVGGVGDLTVNVRGSYTYTGSEQTPTVTVTRGSTPLTVDTDYELVCTDNTNAGEATVYAIGKGSYVGKVGIGHFNIAKAAGSISYATSTVSMTVGATSTNELTKEGDGTVTYASSDDNKATVNSTTGAVTAVAAGSATITATVADGTNYTYATNTASYTVNVTTKDIKMNPLWYVATYNMGSSTSMESSLNAGYFHNWADAMSKYAASTTSYTAYTNANKTISGQTGTWHLPVKGEWLSVQPGDGTNMFGFVSSGTTAYKSAYATPVWGYNTATKAGISETSYFVKVSDKEMHAIRFIGTDYVSAWKYELLGGFTSGEYGYLKISATLIDGSSITDESSAATWYNSNFSSVTFGNNESAFAQERTFYARGNHNGSSAATADGSIGTSGNYWSATEGSSTSAWYLGFSSSIAYVYNSYRSYGRSVRLFRDN